MTQDAVTFLVEHPEIDATLLAESSVQAQLAETESEIAHLEEKSDSLRELIRRINESGLPLYDTKLELA